MTNEITHTHFCFLFLLRVESPIPANRSFVGSGQTTLSYPYCILREGYISLSARTITRSMPSQTLVNY